jgi:hypothetical protein
MIGSSWDVQGALRGTRQAHGEHHPQTGTPGLPNAYFLHMFTVCLPIFSFFSLQNQA